ncbi:MAG: CPBP family intramembrane metalloprotease, partial [Planctomycetaceae bacterium]|nr:CPBP family intramembrane metalloprotease [Planctomycetaceae bacterium]
LFLASSGLRNALLSPEQITNQVLFSGLVTVLLFGGIPLVQAKWHRVPPSDALAIRPVAVSMFAGAALLGISLWPMAYEALVFVQSSSSLVSMAEKYQDIAARIAQTPLWLRITGLAVLPAVCEEIFFRGMLLGGLLSNNHSRTRAVVISTTLFAAMHVVIDQSLYPQRFVTTFLLGLALALIRVRTGSILPGILLHCLNNSLLLSLERMEPVLRLLGLDQNNASHLPAWFLLTSLAVAVVGALVIAFAGKPRGGA